MRFIYYSFIVLFGCSLLLPFSLPFFGIGKSKLGGITKAAKPITLSFQTFAGHLFQKKIERNFAKKLSIFSPLVKTDNQLSLWLFKQISSNPRSRVILGNKGHLIERAYLSSFNREKLPKQSTLAALVDKIYLLDRALSNRGKSLVILISTNKPSFYPELVPDSYVIKSKQALDSASNVFISLLKRKGLSPFDSKDFLKQVAAETKLPIFAPTGTHWNQFATCKVAAELVARIGRNLSKIVPTLECTTKGLRKLPTEQDMDLLKITNLLFPETLIQPAPLVISKVTSEPGATKPKLLLIGTSFSGELMAALNRNPVFDDREFLYYFNRSILPRAGTSRPLNKKTFDVLAAIDRNDAVVLEVNEAFVQRIGYGFIKRALKVLD